MKTKDYIAYFGLDKENQKFNREEFLQLFGKDFLDRLKINQDACLKMGVAFTFQKFLNLVKEHQQRYDKISQKKVGAPLTEGLWGAFYATVIVKIRAEIFPEESRQLTEAWEKKQARGIISEEKL